MMYCCSQMRFHIQEKERIIDYDSTWRQYAIRVNTTVIQLIDYCPWCGVKLPQDLNDVWFELLEDEFGIKDPTNEDKDKVPKEFKTDEWWKKRGL